MTDRELLERAAKAAGIDMVNQPFRDSISTAAGGLSWKNWNPLTDDGDALRLAVKLSLIIDISEPEHPGIGVFKSHPRIDLEEPKGADPYAATRRAIVRAAASMYEEASKETT